MKLLFLLVFLSACQTPVRVFQAERCQTFFKFDAAKQIILDESVCRCTNYKLSLEWIGNITPDVTRHPIEYCHEKIGFSVKDNKTLVDFYFNVRDDINTSQNFYEQNHTENQTNY